MEVRFVLVSHLVLWDDDEKEQIVSMCVCVSVCVCVCVYNICISYINMWTTHTHDYLKICHHQILAKKLRRK